MKLTYRLLYYFIGFFIGSCIVYYIWGEKNTSFDYSPNARVLKNIRIKERAFSEQALIEMNRYEVDTAQISQILKSGDVDFGKSNTKLDSCKTYYIEGTVKEKNIGLSIENCDSIANINSLKLIY